MSSIRFAYLDSMGREVRLTGEDAVRAGMYHGTIGPDTPFFDAEVGGWARAECHPLFREVMEGGSATREDQDDPIQELWRFPARFREVEDPQEAEGVRSPAWSDADATEPDLDGLPLDLSLAEADPSTGEGPARAWEAWRDQDAGLAPPRDGEPLVLDLSEEPAESRRKPNLPEEQRGADQAMAEEPTPYAPRPTARERREPAVLDPGDAVREKATAPRPLWVLPSPWRSWRRRWRGTRRRGAMTAVGFVVVMAAVVLAAGARSSKDGPGGAEPAETGPPAGLGGHGEGADSLLGLLRPAGLAARILRTMERADADVVAALQDRMTRDSLPAAPPERWLEGEYLARASRYPDVPAYWKALGRWTAELEADLPRLVGEHYKARLDEGGFTGRTAHLLLMETLEDFRGRASRRETVFAPMTELVEAALDLHGLLVRRESDIRYEPFSRERITRDPILEAVPSDPELEEEIWAHVTRITRALDQMESLEDPSTDRLQGAVVQGLRASLGR